VKKFLDVLAKIVLGLPILAVVVTLVLGFIYEPWFSGILLGVIGFGVALGWAARRFADS
jgi:hypothetical protein